MVEKHLHHTCRGASRVVAVKLFALLAEALPLGLGDGHELLEQPAVLHRRAALLLENTRGFSM